MAHQAQRQFCEQVREASPAYFKDVSVLDVGSLDINGSNRYLFSGCSYVGVDVGAGRNVDLVSRCHELQFLDGAFDTIISTECFEHDPYFDRSLINIYRMLKSGGLFLFTCATTGRPEHGTVHREPADSPLTLQLPDFKDYYRNLTKEDVSAILPLTLFQYSNFVTRTDTHDLQFWGIKK